METRNQIIQILENELLVKIENDFVRKGVAENITNAILALPLYSKEFVEWMSFDCNFDVCKSIYGKIIWIDTETDNELTLDQLREYWLTNIKDKYQWMIIQ